MSVRDMHRKEIAPHEGPSWERRLTGVSPGTRKRVLGRALDASVAFKARSDISQKPPQGGCLLIAAIDHVNL